MKKMTLCVACLGCLMVVPAWAQAAMPKIRQTPSVEHMAETPTAYTTPYSDDGVVAGRPRNTDVLETVAKRKFQVETSFDYQHESNRGPSTDSYTFPTKLRYGLTQRTELQVRGNMLTFNNSAGATAHGFGDLFFGTKWNALNGGGYLPSVGVSGALGLPTGSNNVSGNALQPEGKTILSWNLPWELTLDSNLGIDLPTRDSAGDKFARFLYGAAVQRDLPVWNHRLNAFVEFAGATPIKSGKSGQHQFGTGIGFKIRDNMQVDSFARAGLNRASPNFQTGLGFAWRL